MTIVPNQIPYESLIFSEEERFRRTEEFYQLLKKRRTIRDFSNKPVSREIIENIIRTASTGPSGANKQPYTFCAVSNLELKTEIRMAAEKEEYENYTRRMSEEWLKDLEPFGTTWEKPFLEIAPWLIVVFRRIYEQKDDKKQNNYYVQESVGIATGMLLTAIHYAGLVALTHTPSPMNFLGEILKRPANEKPFLLIPVGYPATGAKVPDISKKSLEEISVFFT